MEEVKCWETTMDIKDYIRLAVCTTILFTLLAHPSPVSACSCEGGLTIANQIAQHDAIFTGRVVRIVDNYYPIFSNLDNIFRKFSLPSYFINEDGRYWGYSVFLDVFTSWKGVEKTIVEVDTGSGGSDCGYTFEVVGIVVFARQWRRRKK